MNTFFYLAWPALLLLLAFVVNGLALRWSTQRVERFKPTFLRACLAPLPGVLAIYMAAALVGLLMLAARFALEQINEHIASSVDQLFTESPLREMLAFPFAVAAFLLLAISIRRFLKRPDGSRMKLWPEACLITFLTLLISGVLQAAIFLLIPTALLWLYS